MDDCVTRPRLYINHPAHLDWLIALEFGRVDDGQPPECWEDISEHFGWLHDGPDGPIVGFKVRDFSTFDATDDEHAPIWTGPRFHAPLVGLTDATAGEITIAADALLQGHEHHQPPPVQRRRPEQGLPRRGRRPEGQPNRRR